MRTLLLTIVALTALGTAAAQDEALAVSTKEKVYTLSVMAGGGYSRDMSLFTDTKNDLTINRDQFSVFGRVLWRPGNLLTGGLEVGYMNFLSAKNEAGGTAVRSAVPMYLLFSMSPYNGIDVTVGYGFALISATVSGAGETVNSSTFSTGLMAAASYRYPITDRIRIGAEARYSHFDHLDDHAFSLSAILSYRITAY